MSRITPLRGILPYVLFLALVCIFLWRSIFTGAALLPGDYLARMSPWNTVVKSSAPTPQWNPLQWDAIAQYYPWRVFYAQSMRQGIIPLWNPYQFCGTPFLANGQSAVLYPPNLVYVIFDPITACTIYAALHLFLAAAFTYKLLRELGCKELGGIVGGITFAFSAFMVLWLELPTFAGAAVWLPLTLFLIHRSVERRSVFYGMLSGLTIATAFLAGHFQIAFYVAFAAGLWWLWKLVSVWRSEGQLYTFLRVIVPMIGCIAIAALIASAQILPTLELAQNSHRVREVSAEGYERFVGNALPVYRLITAFAPDYFGNPSRGNYYLIGVIDGHPGSAADYMEYGMYAGILPLMLALIALARFRKQRYVGFFVLLALIALLTAVGTPINLFFYYVLPGFSAFGGPNRILLLYMFGIAALAGFGANYVLAAPIIARAKSRMSGDVLSIFVVAVIVADLFAFGINYNPTCDRSRVYPDTRLTKKLQSLTRDGSRIAPINPSWSLYKTPNAILPPNAAMVYGLYDVQGYDSLFTKDYQSRLAQIEGVDPSPPENGNMVLVRRYTDDLAGFADYILSREPIVSDNLKSIGIYDGVRVYRSQTGGVQSALPLLGDRVGVRGKCEPFSFRFGLFLSLVGVSMLTCVGVYHKLKHDHRKR